MSVSDVRYADNCHVACIISHTISVMCDVESKYFLYICGEKKDV